MPTPAQERMQWDPLSVAGTRPAMKGGVPFYAVFPIFFLPAVIVVLTFKIWFMALIPVMWIGTSLLYAGDHTRPFRYVMWVISGACLANWQPWGGASIDPQGSPPDVELFMCEADYSALPNASPKKDLAQ